MEGRPLYFCPVVSFLLSSFFIPRLISAAADWISTTHGVALVQIYNVGLKCAARSSLEMQDPTRMWANAQPDGRPAEHRWRPLFNAAKFG